MGEDRVNSPGRGEVGNLLFPTLLCMPKPKTQRLPTV